MFINIEYYERYTYIQGTLKILLSTNWESLHVTMQYEIELHIIFLLINGKYLPPEKALFKHPYLHIDRQQSVYFVVQIHGNRAIFTNHHILNEVRQFLRLLFRCLHRLVKWKKIKNIFILMKWKILYMSHIRKFKIGKWGESHVDRTLCLMHKTAGWANT